MNVIAQSQATEHTLLQTSKAKSVFIMLDPFLQHRSNDHRVVALRNDRSNAMDVVRYYLDAGYTITLVADSKLFPTQTARLMKSNYCGSRVPMLDSATGIYYSLENFRSTVTYLTLCNSLSPCKETSQWLSKQLIRTVPLTNSTTEACVNTFLSDLQGVQSIELLRAALDEQLEQNRNRVRKFMSPTLQTKTITVDSLRSPLCSQLINDSKTLAVRAATGTGKTKHLFGPLAKAARSKNKKIVYLSYLTALVEQYCNDNLAVSYNQDLCELEQADAMGVVVNSIWKSHIRSVLNQADILIIDEFEKVLTTVVCSEPSKQLPKQQVFESLSEVIRNVPQLIVGDADLSDISLSYIKELRSEVTLLDCKENPYSSIKAVITDKNQYLSNVYLKEQLTKKDKVFLFDSLVTLRQVTQSLGYKDSNRLDCEEEALKDGVLIIHAHNKDMPAQKAFLENPNEEIKKYNAIMASPCLSSGFSITTHFTNKVVVFCDKTLTPLELINFARRFRTAKQIWFAVDAYKDFITPHAKETTYKPTLHVQPTDKLNIAFNNVKKRFFAPLALHLHLTLEELGFMTTSAPSSFTAQLFAQKSATLAAKAYKELEVQAIVSSPDLTQEQASWLWAKDRRTSSDNASLTKFQIKRDYGVKKVTEDDVNFHFKFLANRSVFDSFPFVNRSGDKVEIEDKHHSAAMFIYDNILRKYGFSVGRDAFWIHKDDVRQIVKACYLKQELLNWAFKDRLHISKPLHQEAKPNKATSYLKKLLNSLGFEVGTFRSSSKKAKVELHKNARNYAYFKTAPSETTKSAA